MKKWLCAMLALALALTAFAAFDAPAASAEATELRFFDIASSTGRMEFFNKVFDEYYEKTGVRYTYDGAPWGTDSGIMTMLAAGNGPDVFVYQPHNEVYIGNGWMLPIDEWVDAHRDEYVTLVADYFWVNERNTYGHNYAFPDATLSRGIYYRKDWVEEIGYEIPTGKDWTWAAMWDLCEALTDPEKNRYGFDFRGGSGIDGWAKNYLSAYAGTYIYDPETLKWKRDEYREGMKTYTDCYLNGWTPEDSLNWAWAEQIDAFCSGLVGLFYNDSDCFPYMMERMEEGTWGVLPLPYSNDGLGVPTDINPTYSYAINAKTANPDACIGLIEFFNEPDRTVEYCMMMGEIPVRKDVVNNPYFAEDGPLGEFVKALNNPDALLGGQLIGVNFENWAGYHYDMAGEMQSYLLGETTFDEFFDAYAEFNETAIDNYFAENPDSATDIFRLRDIVGEAE